jgi:hypothetical protein
MSKTKLCVIAVILAFVAPAVARGQDNITHENVEITPFAGWRTGGGLSGDLDGTLREFGIKNGASYGGTLDLNLHRANLKLEVLYSRHSTELETAGLLPGGAPLTVEYLQGGLLQETGNEHRRFFISALAGATKYAPRGFDSVTKFSMSLGGGAKFFLGRNVGLRFEGRAYLTFLETDGGAFCANGTCLFAYSGKNMWQGEFTGGLILAF